MSVPHIRFDERDVEMELWIGLRRRQSGSQVKAAGNGYSPILPPLRHVSTLPKYYSMITRNPTLKTFWYDS